MSDVTACPLEKGEKILLQGQSSLQRYFLDLAIELSCLMALILIVKYVFPGFYAAAVQPIWKMMFILVPIFSYLDFSRARKINWVITDRFLRVEKEQPVAFGQITTLRRFRSNLTVRTQDGVWFRLRFLDDVKAVEALIRGQMP